jgi:hypothetical protein
LAKIPHKKVAHKTQAKLFSLAADGQYVFNRELANKSILNEPHATDPRKEKRLLLADKERAEIDGRKSYFDLRKGWSWALIIWISILVTFNIALTALVGLGILSFEKYQWFITTVIVETFLQIVGMGYIAVNYLFSDKNRLNN